jgi:hypothetical protein
LILSGETLCLSKLVTAGPFGHGGFPSSPAGALSLLSSARGVGAPWLIPAAADISARSSAALDELIAENRAALLARQFFADRCPGRVLPGQVPGWPTTPFLAQPGRADDNGVAGRYNSFEAPSAGHTMTVDLMQTPLRPVPERAARTPKDDGCSSSGAWASVEGAPGHVV